MVERRIKWLGAFLLALNTVRVGTSLLVYFQGPSAIPNLAELLPFPYLGLALFFKWELAPILASLWSWMLGMVLITKMEGRLIYTWSELALTAPSWYVLANLFMIGPSFHTGSHEQHLAMLLAMLWFSAAPVGFAWFLAPKRKAHL